MDYWLPSLNTLISPEGVSSPVKDHKIIHDSVHGSIRVDGPALSLIETPELQRLHSIHQLGLAYLVYPGANHTRFEHSLGTFAVARRICSSLNLARDEAVLVECAALLHDVGHLPFSHTLEFVLHDQFQIDHEEISKRLIRGESSVVSDADGRIIGKFDSVAEALRKHDVDPKEVAKLLDKTAAATAQKTIGGSKGQAFFNSRRYLSQIITGPVDADQLDYLKRDAHYTGVAYGVIDLDRLYETLRIFNGDLVVDRGGLSAVEGMLVARALMFSSVYFHKTVRISELMLAKAVEQLGEGEVGTISAMTDSGLLSYLAAKGGYFEEIATLIKFRRLYKKSFAIRMADLSHEELERIEGFGDMRSRRSAEEDIARRAGVDPGRVVIDIPSTELTVSEPRISLTNLRVIDDGKVRMLHRMSPIAASLQMRRVHEWALMVACPAKDKEKVRKAAEKVLSR
jgi:hypothetical protein